MPVPPVAGSPETYPAFLASVLAASDDCIKILSLDGRLAFMSEGGKRVMEVDDFEAIRGCNWPDFWEGDGNGEARQAIEKARGGGSARFQATAPTMRGNPRWWDVKVSPILDSAGTPAYLLSVSRDITAIKAAEAASRDIAREMGHRLKNILTIVRAIAVQTLKGTTDDAIVSKLTGRIVSLSKAHDVLLSDSPKAGRIRDVVYAVAAMETLGDRIGVDGPNIQLNPQTVVTLSMLLHELSTNAMKHGALSNAHGRVAVTWKVDSATSHARFALAWSESGGPVVEPPTKAGLGSRLIDAGLPGTDRSDVRYEPEGFRAMFTALMEDIQA